MIKMSSAEREETGKGGAEPEGKGALVVGKMAKLREKKAADLSKLVEARLELEEGLLRLKERREELRTGGAKHEDDVMKENAKKQNEMKLKMQELEALEDDAQSQLKRLGAPAVTKQVQEGEELAGGSPARTKRKEGKPLPGKKKKRKVLIKKKKPKVAGEESGSEGEEKEKEVHPPAVDATNALLQMLSDMRGGGAKPQEGVTDDMLVELLSKMSDVYAATKGENRQLAEALKRTELENLVLRKEVLQLKLREEKRREREQDRARVEAKNKVLRRVRMILLTESSPKAAEKKPQQATSEPATRAPAGKAEPPVPKVAALEVPQRAKSTSDEGTPEAKKVLDPQKDEEKPAAPTAAPAAAGAAKGNNDKLKETAREKKNSLARELVKRSRDRSGSSSSSRASSRRGRSRRRRRRSRSSYSRSSSSSSDSYSSRSHSRDSLRRSRSRRRYSPSPRRSYSRDRMGYWRRKPATERRYSRSSSRSRSRSRGRSRWRSRSRSRRRSRTPAAKKAEEADTAPAAATAKEVVKGSADKLEGGSKGF